MNQEKIGNYIALKRKELNLTQDELAEKLGVTNRSISRWENGKTMPDVSLFKDICNILNITLEELLSGEEQDGNIETINYLKYQKKVYKYRLIMIISIFLILIFSILYIIFKPYKLEFSDTLDYSKPIYNIDDNTKLYSKFENNYYIKNIKLELSEALEKNVITIEQIKNDMVLSDALNDGGTTIYKSRDNKYYLISCNNYIGNKNYYITGNEYDYSVCSYEKEIGLNNICLRDKLDDKVSYDKTIKLRDNYNAYLITNGNIPSWDIYNGTKGWYAIIKTDDEDVINDFKNWFNNKDNNYKYFNIYENWYVFISNGNDIDFKELNDCIK